ncbi:hypothetical protein [uncultured Jatrophihabitans sp.]|uniref:hypothetical protein n=1 Tax=uncultured Jatrophihabitans sp. TaxID=1610747 RepID=UPI0035C99BAF
MSTPRLPEQFRDDPEEEFNVSELVSEAAGAHSPFGNIEYPIPADQLAFYKHPRPQDRPNLAGGRNPEPPTH